jgi:hypothetical protein
MRVRALATMGSDPDKVRRNVETRNRAVEKITLALEL